MTVHPPTITPRMAGVAEAHVPLALELVDAVHRWDRRDVMAALDRADLEALAVVLAAMVDQDRTLTQMLGWTDAHMPTVRARSERPLVPCGTPSAAKRHKTWGEPVCPPCLRALREYDRDRAARKRAAA